MKAFACNVFLTHTHTSVRVYIYIYIQYSFRFFFHSSLKSLGDFLLFTLHHSRLKSLYTKYKHDRLLQWSNYQAKRDCKKKEKQPFIQQMCIFYVVESIKEIRTVRVDCRLLISGIVFFSSFFGIVRQKELTRDNYLFVCLFFPHINVVYLIASICLEST